MRRRILLFCSAGLMCWLSFGCGSDFPLEQFSQIEKGMTEEAVVVVLGEGREVSWAEVESIVKSFPQVEFTEDTCERWVMWGNGSGYGLVGLKNGRVQELLSRYAVEDLEGR